MSKMLPHPAPLRPWGISTLLVLSTLRNVNLEMKCAGPGGRLEQLAGKSTFGMPEAGLGGMSFWYDCRRARGVSLKYGPSTGLLFPKSEKGREIVKHVS